MGQKRTKFMLYSTLVEIEVEVELGKNRNDIFIFWGPILQLYTLSSWHTDNRIFYIILQVEPLPHQLSKLHLKSCELCFLILCFRCRGEKIIVRDRGVSICGNVFRLSSYSAFLPCVCVHLLDVNLALKNSYQTGI